MFGVAVPTDVPNVPSEVLIPRDTWADQAVYDATAQKLANLFNKNFEQYREGSSDEIAAAGPKV